MNQNSIKRLADPVTLCSTHPVMTNAAGRSMVEMLGVLAIIGILSAGALTGYSKAMFRHKVNQTIDIFSQVLQRFAELKEKDLGDDFSITTADDIIKYGLLPECYKESSDYCKLPIGSLGAEIDNRTSVIWVEFTSPKECIAFGSARWEDAISPEWWNNDGVMSIEGPGTHVLYEPKFENNYTISSMSDACQEECSSDDTCWFQFYFTF